MWQELQPDRKMILLFLGITGLCLVLTKYLFMPQFNRQCENKAKLADLRLKLQAAKAVAESQQRETELAGKVNEQLNEFKPLFDNVMDDGLAFVYIGLKAVESKVEIVSVSPAAVIDQGTYLEFPVRFEVCGGYREVCGFIRQIEIFPNLSEIRTLKISCCDDKETTQDAVGILPTQNGKVKAILDIIIFSSPSPAARIQMGQVSNWSVGRNNAFLTPGAVSPYPGVEPVDKEVYQAVD